MEQKDFEIEVGRIRPHLLQQALRYLGNADDAEDVTQEALLKLWSMRQQLEQYHSIEALAMTMTKHLCLNRLRTAMYSMSDWTQNDMTDGETPEDAYIEKEEERQILKVMKTLPDVQQATLRMKHIDGLEISEIARITGTSEVGVRTNLSRARKKMLNYFGINK